jgi:hypothetical protein
VRVAGNTAATISLSLLSCGYISVTAHSGTAVINQQSKGLELNQLRIAHGSSRAGSS